MKVYHNSTEVIALSDISTQFRWSGDTIMSIPGNTLTNTALVKCAEGEEIYMKAPEAGITYGQKIPYSTLTVFQTDSYGKLKYYSIIVWNIIYNMIKLIYFVILI